MTDSQGLRQTPRVILRSALEGTFDGLPVLVLELGLGGAKFEHRQRLDVGSAGPFTCESISADGRVAYSIMLPGEEGILYHSGISFPTLSDAQKERLFDVLMSEAQEQVREWELNLNGKAWLPPEAVKRSAVASRYLTLRFAKNAWKRTISADPNQPPDGITVASDTPDQEVAILCETYETADEATRELLRRIATVTLLERMR